MPVETGEPVEDYPHFVRTTGASDTRHSPRPLLRVALRPLTFGAAFSCKPRTYVVARTKTRIWSSPRTRGPITPGVDDCGRRLPQRSHGNNESTRRRDERNCAHA